MNFTSMLSLKRRALLKVTTLLWSRSDIEDVVARFNTDEKLVLTKTERLRQHQLAEGKVTEKVHKLPIPESLKKEISDFIQPIGLEVLNWKEHHGQNCGRDISARLCWTPQGTVDQKKTAELLIKDESIDIITRYRLACIYCLEDDVKILWNSMPQREKRDFYNEVTAYDDNGLPKLLYGHWLAVVWTYEMKGELSKFNDCVKEMTGREISSYQFAFEYAAIYRSKAAIEYFFQKLTPRERDESLVMCAEDIAKRIHTYLIIVASHSYDPRENYADILCFLLSLMNEEQQVKVFKDNTCGLLSWLLVWPCQCFFMETANHIWDFLDELEFETLSKMIAKKVIDGNRDYNYHKLFSEFWQRMPRIEREYLMRDWLFGHFLLDFLMHLFELDDKEIFSLILKDATVEMREEIIFDDKAKNICESLIYSNKWDLLKFFVQECISSKDSVIKFKEEFRKHLISRHSEQRLAEDTCRKFFQFLDDLILEDDKKRGMDKGNSSPAVRLKSN